MSCVEVDTAGRHAVELAVAVFTLALWHPAQSRLALVWNRAIVAHGVTTVIPLEYATVFYR